MRNIAQDHANQSDQSWGDLYYQYLIDLINKNKIETFIELGTAFGGLAERILSNTDVRKIICVDSYQNFQGTTDSFQWGGVSYNQNDYENLFEFTKNRLSKYGNRVELLRMSTDEASVYITDNSVDMIFIDALHTKDAVLNDIENYQNKIKKGGIISGHDYNHPNFPGVTEAVDLWSNFNNYKIVEGDGHVWWVKK